eukprot:Gb_07692 [translate_table: standard]
MVQGVNEGAGPHLLHVPFLGGGVGVRVQGAGEWRVEGRAQGRREMGERRQRCKGGAGRERGEHDETQAESRGRGRRVGKGELPVTIGCHREDIRLRSGLCAHQVAVGTRSGWNSTGELLNLTSGMFDPSQFNTPVLRYRENLAPGPYQVKVKTDFPCLKLNILEEYYVFNAEIQLLQQNAMDIARIITPGSLFVELGCGSARKITLLLNAIRAYHGRCRYAGIDISEAALKEAGKNIRSHVHGLEPNAIEFVHADFLDGLTQVKHRHPHDPFCIAWLGNTVGNLSRDDTVDFFKNVIRLVGPNCQLLVCMDMWKSLEILYPAYHDKQGVCERFAKNGMKNALSCIGYLPMNGESVDSFCSFDIEINTVLRRVESYVTFPRSLNLPKYQLQIRPGEKVLMEFSTKFTNEDIERIASDACLQVCASWGDASYYTCQMLLPAKHELLQRMPSMSVEVINPYEETPPILPNWQHGMGVEGSVILV